MAPEVYLSALSRWDGRLCSHVFTFVPPSHSQVGVDASLVSIEVTAASVNIIATITVDVTSNSEASTITETLNTKFATRDAASQLLDIQVESEPLVVAPPSSPPPSTPPLSPPADSSSDGVSVGICGARNKHH